jgi:glyoxylase-like metal-dependent hydrolase (beta-lactamase superfamily II)
VTTNTVRVGNVLLTRVGYADITVDPARVGLDAEQIHSVPWAEPLWADGDEVRAGAAAWVIDSGDTRIVVDPAFAADEVLRTDADAALHQEAFAGLLADAGFARESFTHAIATHYEGVGFLAWRNDDGSWVRFFPNAPILMAQRELDAIDAGAVRSESILPELRAGGAVQGIGDHERITNEVSIEYTGGHAPGHQIVRVDSGGAHAVIVGHLAVSPLHFATGPCPQQHPDPELANTWVENLRAEDTVLIGPLWPSPAAARWDGRQLVAVTE